MAKAPKPKPAPTEPDPVAQPAAVDAPAEAETESLASREPVVAGRRRPGTGARMGLGGR